MCACPLCGGAAAGFVLRPRMPTRIFTLRPSAAPPCRILVTMPDAPIVSPAGASPACAIYLRIPLLPVSFSARLPP